MILMIYKLRLSVKKTLYCYTVDIHQEFTNGSFVVRKTEKVFSSIVLDHAHEQVNAQVKGEGGAVGQRENPAALRRWMIAGLKSQGSSKCRKPPPS